MAMPRMGSRDSSGASPEPFRLDGPSRRLDPRVNAFRADIADVRLAGKLFAPHYASARPCSVAGTAAAIRGMPDAKARMVTQLLPGEEFEMLDLVGDWAWGRCVHDGYVGYVRASALVPVATVSHRVCAVVAPVFSAPDIKSPVAAWWPLGTRFAGTAEGDFFACAGGFVHHRHARDVDAVEADHVAVAERLIGQPYLWGGRGAGGIDCSGLVQVALAGAGHACPRDSDLQREALGTLLPEDASPVRGDFIFFPAHVGIMVDGERMIHANAHWMAVAVEPLTDVVARLAPAFAQPVVARRRLEPRA